MRTLSDLQKYVSALPKPFAKDVQGKVSDFTIADSDKTNYQNGFPAVYAKDPNASGVDKGKYLLRNDMNALGQMATRELNFKESGGVHTYDSNVATALGGYPSGAILTAYDGEYLSHVESKISGNLRNFLDAEGYTDYAVVNSEVANNEDDESDEGDNKDFLWKIANWITGLSESAFHLEINYSDVTRLANGEAITQDSLVIGSVVCFFRPEDPPLSDGIYPAIYSIDTAQKLKHNTKITLPDGTVSMVGGIQGIVNKGRCGDALGSGVFISYGNGGLKFYAIPVCSYTGGTGNFFLATFAKAGTSFSTTLTISDYNKDSWSPANYTPYWVAIPLSKRIGE